MPLWTVDDVEDVGAVAAAGFGVGADRRRQERLERLHGARERSPGHRRQTGGASPCVVNLLPAADATQPLAIKNLGTVALAVTPNGTDTIDGVNAPYAVARGRAAAAHDNLARARRRERVVHARESRGMTPASGGRGDDRPGRAPAHRQRLRVRARRRTAASTSSTGATSTGATAFDALAIAARVTFTPEDTPKGPRARAVAVTG